MKMKQIIIKHYTNLELIGNKTSHDLNLADANHNHDNLYGTKQEILDLQTNKQDKLTAGENIVIEDNVISVDLNDYLKTEDASNTYETIANVNLLSNIVNGNTEDIESLEENKANKADTLSGYGITDAVTQTEINTKLNNTRTYKILNTPVATWLNSTTHTKYPYEAVILIENIKESDSVEVIYSIPDAESTNYAPGGELYEGYIKIFSKVNTEITIPTLVITKIDL